MYFTGTNTIWSKILNTPKVSVIVPVYNTAPYLRQCLDSIVNQTLKDIEIILVDDCSTDESLTILKEYEAADRRIKVLSQENKGAGAARNTGLHIAKGKYLLFLDSDDYFESAMLEKLYECSESLNTDITVCLYKNIDDTNGYVSRPQYNDIVYNTIGIFSYKDIYENKDCQFDFFIGWTWDKLFRKEFIADIGIEFQEISHSNDGAFVFTAMYAARRITIIKESLVIHRINRKGSIETTHEKNPYSFSKMFTGTKEGLMKIGVYEEVKDIFNFWVLGHSIWVLSKIQSYTPFNIIYKLLQNMIIPEYVVNNVSDAKMNLYNIVKEIKSSSIDEYLFHQWHKSINETERLRGECDGLISERDRLREECHNLREECHNLREECHNLREECHNLQKERINLQEECLNLQNKYFNLQKEYLNSFSYRLGRAITWLPRKILRIFRYK